MFSARFSRPVIITRHAQQRMQERDISPELLLQVIDTGHVRYSDAVRLWAWLEVPGRHDNLLCAAVVLEQAVVVKTVMHHWEVTP
jgi:translation elongation factor EF-Tu-like GTPase